MSNVRIGNNYIFSQSKHKFRDHLESDRSELSENDIEGIKALLDEGVFTVKEIANSYGVDRSVIHKIKRSLKDSDEWEFSA